MTTHLELPEILLRLGLTAVAGMLIGFNRGEHGHAAGLRTTMLVCLAASISMVQVNLLLDLRGKAWDSFIVMDLMRLPLGILSGMGFIGAGAILRKGEAVQGVTTAATLWFATVMGLCFGGGQLVLGLLSLILAFFVLTVLKQVEHRLKRERRGIVSLKLDAGALSDEEVCRQFEARGYRISAWSVAQSKAEPARQLRLTVRWYATDADIRPPSLVAEMAASPGILAIHWTT